MREMKRTDLSDLDLSSSPPTPEWGETNGSTHVVQFYDDEAFPLDAIGRFVGPALGAAVTALAAVESYRRRQQGIAAPYTVADAVARMVKFSEPAAPNLAWREVYQDGLRRFGEQLITK